MISLYKALDTRKGSPFAERSAAFYIAKFVMSNLIWLRKRKPLQLLPVEGKEALGAGDCWLLARKSLGKRVDGTTFSLRRSARQHYPYDSCLS